jgi:ribosomal protein L21E
VDRNEEEAVMGHQVGDRVTVAVESIQRGNGAAWRGDRGQVIGQTGDGYRVRFGDGFIAENVKTGEVTKV